MNQFKSDWKLIICAIAFVVAALFVSRAAWLPLLTNETKVEVEDDHEHHDHDSASNPDTLKLSRAAWKNIGLAVSEVKLSDFVKVDSASAIVVERMGRSQTKITSPMTGIVTKVYPLEREIVIPGKPLFDLRLTHEDVVSAQTEFLTQLQKLDVVEQELARLEGIGEGIIAGKRIVEQKYKLKQATGLLSALRQSLLLHGLSEQQIATIEKTHNVLQNVTIVVPPFADNHDHTEAALAHKYHVQSINVNRGESVTAGELMGVLADHCLLYVQGKAFEEDAARLAKATEAGTLVDVIPVSASANFEDVLHLQVQSVSDQIDETSRALNFYLLLPNELIRRPEDGKLQNKFVAWRYRPGQRMEVRIPTSDTFENKIVLPFDAVVIEGPNAYVFEQNGDNFDRVEAHVLYRDKDSVVLENDGKLVGSTIAISGAYRMHLELKNQAGGAMDPHAGHTH